jgi:serine/threonine protein kinase
MRSKTKTHLALLKGTEEEVLKEYKDPRSTVVVLFFKHGGVTCVAKVGQDMEHELATTQHAFCELPNNVVKLMGLYRHNSMDGFCMLRGMSVHRYCTKKSPRELAAFIEAFVQAILQLHVRGVYHLDVKPANVIVYGDRGQQPVLIDFGNSIVFPPLKQRVELVSRLRSGTLRFRLIDYGIEDAKDKHQQTVNLEFIVEARDQFAAGITIVSLLLTYATKMKKTISACLRLHNNEPHTLFTVWFETAISPGAATVDGFSTYIFGQLVGTRVVRAPHVLQSLSTADALVNCALMALGVPLCDGFVHQLLEATRTLASLENHNLCFLQEWPNLLVMLSVLLRE